MYYESLGIYSEKHCTLFLFCPPPSQGHSSLSQFLFALCMMITAGKAQYKFRMAIVHPVSTQRTAISLVSDGVN